jgi:hypothetical protein
MCSSLSWSAPCRHRQCPRENLRGQRRCRYADRAARACRCMRAAGFDEMGGNLLENAFRWARGKVEVQAHHDEGRSVAIVIDDDGPGLRPDQMSQVLLPGQRIDESAPRVWLWSANRTRTRRAPWWRTQPRRFAIGRSQGNAQVASVRLSGWRKWSTGIKQLCIVAAPLEMSTTPQLMNVRCRDLGTSSGTSMMGAGWPQEPVPCFAGRLDTQSLADRVPASAMATIVRPLPARTSEWSFCHCGTVTSSA